MIRFVYQKRLLEQAVERNALQIVCKAIDAFREKVIVCLQNDDTVDFYQELDRFIATLAKNTIRDYGNSDFNYHCLTVISSLIAAKTLPLAQGVTYTLFALEVFSEKMKCL